MANAPESHPASLRSMREVMAGMMGMEPDLPMPGEPVMLVATTRDSFMGASVIQYPGFMEQAAEQVGGDFFVLPSSIHEVLIIPDDEDFKNPVDLMFEALEKKKPGCFACRQYRLFSLAAGDATMGEQSNQLHIESPENRRYVTA